MNRKGTLLIEIEIALFFIGLMILSLFPILSSSIANFKNTEVMEEMIYIGEMVVEKLHSQGNEITYVINQIDYLGEIYYEDEDFDTDKYKCKITKICSNDKLLEFLVRVELKDEDNKKSVEFKGSIVKS